MTMKTSGKSGLPQPGLDAAREGRGFCSKLNATTGINAAPTVLTDAGLVHNIADGYRDVLTCMYAHLNTDTDWCEFEIGVCEHANGAGTFTALTPRFRIESPTVNDAAGIKLTHFDPPIALTRANGASWTIRAQTNAVDTSVTFGVNGWTEEE